MVDIIFKLKVWWFWFCTIRLYDVSDSWSATLDKLIESGEKLCIIDGFRAKFGNYELWIENHPYASFSIDVNRSNIYYKFMPNKTVGYKLHLLLMDALKANKELAKK